MYKISLGPSGLGLPPELDYGRASEHSTVKRMTVTTRITPKVLRNRERPLLSDDELRSSIATLGPLLPVYRWRGRVVDGTRRWKFCKHLGQDITVVNVKYRRDAARILWTLHPERALLLFPEPDLLSAAALYGSTPARVAVVKMQLREAPPPPPCARLAWDKRRGPERIPRQGGTARKVQLWLDIETRRLIRRARIESGDTTEAAFLRRAIATRLAEFLGGEPDDY